HRRGAVCIGVLIDTRAVPTTRCPGGNTRVRTKTIRMFPRPWNSLLPREKTTRRGRRSARTGSSVGVYAGASAERRRPQIQTAIVLRRLRSTLNNRAVDDHAIEAGAVVRMDAKRWKIRTEERDEDMSDLIAECCG